MPTYKLSRNSDDDGMGGRDYIHVVENRKRRYHENLSKRVPN